MKPLLNEYAAQKLKHAELSEQLEPLEHDLGSLREIRGHVDDILDRQEREQREQEREHEREQHKERKNTNVLQQKILESRQKLREQRESRKKKRGEMER